MTREFLTYKLFSADENSCADQILSTVQNAERSCKVLACMNPHTFVIARGDKVFGDALKRSDWLIPDGIGIVWASRLLGNPLIGRVTGPDVFSATMSRLESVGASVFFLGSTDETLEKIKKKVSDVYPGVHFAGTFSPPFKPEFSAEDNARMLSAVNAASPDFLWVGMTAPKQEKWLAANRDHLNVKAAGAVGAVFDFFAGNVPRSPRIMQRAGLEWLHRSITSPARLGRRNATSNPKFVFHVLRHKFYRGRF